MVEDEMKVAAFPGRGLEERAEEALFIHDGVKDRDKSCRTVRSGDAR